MPRRVLLPLIAAALGLTACLDDTTSPVEPDLDRPQVESAEPHLSVSAAATVTWTARAPMRTARDRLAAGVVANAAGQPILYAVGGNDNASVPLAKVEAYNPATNTRTTKASLPAARNLPFRAEVA